MSQSCSAIRAKHLSAENRFSINHSLSLPPEEAHEHLIASIKPNNYVTCQYGDYWWLALVMDVIQMRRTSLVSLSIHMATQRTTMSPVNMETTGG